MGCFNSWRFGGSYPNIDDYVSVVTASRVMVLVVVRAFGRMITMSISVFPIKTPVL